MAFLIEISKLFVQIMLAVLIISLFIRLMEVEQRLHMVELRSVQQPPPPQEEEVVLPARLLTPEDLTPADETLRKMTWNELASLAGGKYGIATCDDKTKKKRHKQALVKDILARMENTSEILSRIESSNGR